MIGYFEARDVVQDLTALNAVVEEVHIDRTFNGKDYSFTIVNGHFTIWFDDEAQADMPWDKNFPASTANWIREHSA